MTERRADRADLASVVRAAGGADVVVDTVAYDDGDARLLAQYYGDAMEDYAAEDDVLASRRS